MAPSCCVMTASKNGTPGVDKSGDALAPASAACHQIADVPPRSVRKRIRAPSCVHSGRSFTPPPLVIRVGVAERRSIVQISLPEPEPTDTAMRDPSGEKRGYPY